MKNPTKDQLAAQELVKEIRWVLGIHPNKNGWVVRCRHTHRKGEKPEIVIDHQDARQDMDLAAEAHTLRQTVRILGLADKIGYKIVSLHAHEQLEAA